jgi:hypothetical protein
MTDQPQTTEPDFGRPFVLVRDTDISGVSGVGVVADGTLFPDGHAVIHWRGNWPTTTPHPGGMESVLAVHGHGGATRVRWQTIQGPPPARYQDAWTELTGYVMEACADGGQIDPVAFLAYMREKRHEALAPAREWARGIVFPTASEEPTP